MIGEHVFKEAMIVGPAAADAKKRAIAATVWPVASLVIS
jgi:hypothetical protein